LIRVLAVLVLRHINQPPGLQMGADGIEFDHLGRALADGRGFVWDDRTPTSFRAPGFPVFLAVIYTVRRIRVPLSLIYRSVCWVPPLVCFPTC